MKKLRCPTFSAIPNTQKLCFSTLTIFRSLNSNLISISTISTAMPMKKLSWEDFRNKQLCRTYQNYEMLCKEGRLREAFRALCEIDVYCSDVCSAFLEGCIASKSHSEGKRLHAHMIKKGFGSGIFLQNNLLNLYRKCGLLEDARQVFDKMLERNLVTWTCMITGYCQDGYWDEALRLFCHIQAAGLRPNEFTFGIVLKVCARLNAPKQGNQVHACIVKSGYESDVYVGSALANMYAKCGSIADASMVFDTMPQHDSVSWTANIAGYAHSGFCEIALKLFPQMQSMGVEPNHFTFVTLLNTCTFLIDLEQGLQFHGLIMKSGFESDVFVGSALVDMYSKCGSIRDAQKVFHGLSERDMVSWSAMIAGYAQHGHGVKALKLFCQMKRLGMKGDEFTFASSLTACCSLTSLERGKWMHAQIIRAGFNQDVYVQSALLDMYSKCGSIDDARNVFNRMSERNKVSWTAMIVGCAQHGQAKEALQIFNQMQLADVKPDSLTFVGVLSACSHAGLVDKGYHYFHSISRVHGLTPTLEHYACMVDILGRAGCLYEAEKFINQAPYNQSALVWRTLLGACRIHGEMEIGQRAAEWVLELEPQYPATYVLLSNIYAAAGAWDDARKVRNMMRNRGLRKEPGCSWIEIKNKWHVFVVQTDHSHKER